MSEIRSETSLLVVFVDLTRFGPQSQRVDDTELADTIDAYYEQVGAAVQAAGGRVVKFVGDGVLIVFPEEAVDRGVEMLLALKDAVDGAMAARRWECRLAAKAHFGPTIAGPFGIAGDKRFDVLGHQSRARDFLPAHRKSLHRGMTLSRSRYPTTFLCSSSTNPLAS
jgi:adenylate cyclase